MTLNSIIQWIEQHFNKRSLLIGVVLVVSFFFLQQLACPPKPVVVSTKTQDSASIYHNQVDSLIKEIHQIHISKEIQVPSSDSVTAPGQRIDTVNKPYYIYIHDKQEIKVPIKDIQTDSCPAIILHQFASMQGNAGGFYEVTGLVSCKTGIVYNLQIIAHATLRIDTTFSDTTVQHYLRDSVFQLKERLQTALLKQTGSRFEIFAFGEYDPFFSKEVQFGVGGNINLNDVLSIYTNAGIGTAGLKSAVGVNYFILRR